MEASKGPSSKYDGMSRDELLSQVQKQITLLKRSKAKIDQLQSQLSEAQQSPQSLVPKDGTSTPLDDASAAEVLKYKKLAAKFKQSLASKTKEVEDIQAQTTAQGVANEELVAAVKELQDTNEALVAEVTELKAANERDVVEMEQLHATIKQLQTSNEEQIQKCEEVTLDFEELSHSLETFMGEVLERMNSEDGPPLDETMTFDDLQTVVIAKLDLLCDMERSNASAIKQNGVSGSYGLKDAEQGPGSANPRTETADAANQSDLYEFDAPMYHSFAGSTGDESRGSEGWFDQQQRPTGIPLSPDVSPIKEMEASAAQVASQSQADHEKKVLELSSMVEDLKAQLGEKETELKDTTVRLAALQTETEALRQDLKDVQQQHKADLKQQDLLQSQVEKAEGKVTDLKRQLKAAAEQADSTNTADTLLVKANLELDEANQKISELQAELDRCHEQEQHTEKLHVAALAEQQDKVQELQASLSVAAETADAVDTLQMQLETSRQDNSRLAGEVEGLTTQLSELKQRAEEAAASASQSSMLDLELADYKRTVQTLNKRLEDTTAELENGNKTVAQLETSLEEVTTAKSQVEADKKKADQLAAKMKQLLAKVRTQLQEKSQLVEARDTTIDELQDKLQQLSADQESSVTSVDDLNRKLHHLEQTNSEAQMAFQAERAALQQQYAKAISELDQAREENTTLRTDFQKYKVRVHNTFREDKHRQQAEELRTKLDETTSQLDQVQTALMVKEERLNESHSLYNELEAHYHEALSKVDELTTRIGSLEQARDEAIKQQREARQSLIDQHNLLIENLKKTHSTALSTLQDSKQLQETQHATTVHQLNATVADLRSQLQDVQSKLQQVQSEHVRPTSHGTNAQNGSRTQSSTPSLLSRSASPGTVQDRVSSSTPTQPSLMDLIAGRASTPHLQAPPLTPLEQKVTDLEYQLQHITSLLNESEGNLQKLAEQNTVLKQQIRVDERNAARGELNLEYLKNIVLQYLACQEEREHLVPVLGTILQFTPDESKQLKRSILKQQATKSTGWGFPGW
eukprot:m.310222 g.310222  ORF g.310222 m.310222 type:complete len:1038 (+) comp15949_c0_seq3:227-3340(+)